MTMFFICQVGLDKVNKSPDTQLLYVTTGILLNELVGEGRINRYTHLIIDEVILTPI
jgi:HrpA-like RNA helicase